MNNSQVAIASNIPQASLMPDFSNQSFISNLKDLSKIPLQMNQNRSSPMSNKKPDASINNIVGVVIMVKNEQTSIQATIDSVKDYIKHIIVFDTGSTDKTIEIVQNTCKQNKQILH